MAAAIIPLIAGIAPPIINLIAGLVNKHAPAAETQFGPGTGPIKFADVFSNVINALQKSASAGTIDKTLPPDDTIKLIIQSIVSSLNISGQLSPQETPNSPKTLTIIGGTLQVQ